MNFRIRLFSLSVATTMAVTAPLAAQRVLGPWDDASTLRAGSLRLSVGSLWDRANERYDADGKLHTLGAAASPASWNGAYDARLGAATPLVAALSGIGSFDASLGALTIGRRDASTDVPVTLEVGLLSRVTLGAHVRIVNHAIETGLRINPLRTEATMGFNPAWLITGAYDQDALLVAQFDSATAQTTRRLAQCQSTPSTSGCAPLLANVAGVQALLGNATAFANALNQLYGGRANGRGLPFVPVASSSAHLAITQRVLGYRDQFGALGNSAIAVPGPIGAAPFADSAFAQLLTDSLYGYRLRALRSVRAYGLAEASVTAKVRLFDNTGNDTTAIHGFKLRQSAGIALRLGGAGAPPADEVFPPVAGDIAGGVTLQSFTDLFWGSRLASSFSVAYAQTGAESFAMRLPAAGAPAVGGVPFPILGADREVRLSRTPGPRFDLTVVPRYAVSSAIWLGASWSYSRQSADTWTIASMPAGGTAVPADAAKWSAGTDWVEQRMGLGATYSTGAAVRAGRARYDFDISYTYQQTTAGTGWRVAKLTRDVVTVRWYRRLWGR